MKKETIVIDVTRISYTLFHAYIVNTTREEALGILKFRALGLKNACDILFSIGDGFAAFEKYDIVIGSKNSEVDMYIHERIKIRIAELEKEAAAKANNNRHTKNND